MALVVDSGGLVNKGGALGTGAACCCNKCSGPCDGENPCPEGCVCCGGECQPSLPVCDGSPCSPGDCPEGCGCFDYYQQCPPEFPEGNGIFNLGSCRSASDADAAYRICNTLGDEFADSPCNNNCPEGWNCCDGTCYDVPCDRFFSGCYQPCDCENPCPEGCQCVDGECVGCPPPIPELECGFQVPCRPGECPEGCECFGYIAAAADCPFSPGLGQPENLGFCAPWYSGGQCNSLGIEFAGAPCNNECPPGYTCCEESSTCCFGGCGPCCNTPCDCDNPCPEGCECGSDGRCREGGEAP